MKNQVAKITANPIGAVAGAAVAFWAAKKFGNVSNKWALIGITVAGVVAGAFVQAKIVAKKGTPTAATTK